MTTDPISHPRPRLATRLVAAGACLLMLGCVSRNVESIDDEEAAAMGSPPAPTASADREQQEPEREVASDAPASDGGIVGRLVVGDEVEAVPPGILYLIVRVAGRETGAPLAVKRLGAAELPVDFRITEADAMIPGTPLVGEMDVIARLDQDGDAFTEEAGDLTGRAEAVEVGEPVEIVLRAASAAGTGS